MGSWSKTSDELMFEPNQAYQSGIVLEFSKKRGEIVVLFLFLKMIPKISFYPYPIDTKIELKEYEHTISYLQKGEDVEKGIKNVDDRFSLIGVKLGKNYLLRGIQDYLVDIQS